MRLGRLYNTVAMVEDDSTLYNSLAMMPVKIVGYHQTSYHMPQ